MKKLLLLTTAFACAFLSASSQNVPSYVPSDGLVGWWPFNGNANDESANGNNGTVNGAVLTEDRNATTQSAFSFTGNSEISINATNLPLNNSPRTISFWAKFDSNISTSDWAGIVSYGTNENGGTAANSGVLFDVFIGNNDNSLFYVNNGEFTSTASPGQNLSGQWHFFLVTYDGIQLENINFWIDGVFYNDVTMNYLGINSLITNTSPLYFGKTNVSYGSANHYYYNGLIDDIGIWNRALTESEIQQLYEGCNVQGIAISGNNTPAAIQPSTYTCTGEAGSTFTWTVTNGVITSGQGTNSVNVVWAETGLGSISVQETTSANCTGELITLDVVVIPTSVNELSAHEISIYPNPASNRLSIAHDASSNGKSYAIYNITGSLVHSGKLVGNITSLSLEEFAIGQYTLRVEGSSPKTFAVAKE